MEHKKLTVQIRGPGIRINMRVERDKNSEHYHIPVHGLYKQ